METEDDHAPPQVGTADFGDVVMESAFEAEFATGHRGETIEEAQQGVVVRVMRIVAGFALISVGLAALVLPGSGWALIVVGLSLLPFPWAERTVRSIRRKVPGLPEEGNIPTRTWVIMGATMVGFMAASVLFGDDLNRWVSSAWGDPGSLLG